MMKKQLLCLCSLVALLALPLTARAADYVPKIIAGVVKADSWTLGNNREGIYSLEVKTGGQLTQQNDGQDKFLAPLGGAVYQDGTMYGIHFKQEWDPYEQANTYTIYNVAYDMQSWTRTKGQALSNMYGNLISSCGITHDPVTGLNFGIFYNFNMSYQVINRKLATIDFIDTEASGAPKKQVVGVVETPFAAIAAAENGFLYGVGLDGFLYIIDKVLEEEATSVAVYPLADLGIADISTNPSSMTFDPRTKKLYWSYVSTAQKSYLYEIEGYGTLTPKAVKVMDVPDNAYLVNMYIAPMEAADDAPAAVSDLTAVFEGEKTTGTVSFTMPALTYSGDALSGTLDYVVYADGAEVATGTAEAGSEVSRQVTVDTEGSDVELRVVAKNAAGEGAPQSVALYIGRDVPLAVQNLKLTYNADTEYTRLSWEAPTTGVHGKTLTEYNLSYNIVRQPGDVTVATGLKLPAFGEKIEKTSDLTSYHYEVVAVNGSHESEKAVSNAVVVGQALVPPFDENFTTQQGFDRFTVIDVAGDGYSSYGDWRNVWVRYHKEYTYSGTTVDYAMIYAQNDDDDYLLTPPLQLEKGGRYELTFTAAKAYADKKYNQKMRVLVGLAGDDISNYTVVGDGIDITDVNMEEFTRDIRIEADGIYQIAFHAQSPAGSGQLYLDEVYLAASLLATAPEAATDVVATGNPDGYLTATVTFTAPDKTLHGDALTAISHIDAVDVDDNVLGRLTDVTPGQQCSMPIAHLQNGNNTCYLIAYAGDAPGAKAPFTVVVGQDYPLPPTDIALTDDGTEAVLTWKAPTEGINGLPLNPELLQYNLYEISSDGRPTLLQKDIQSPYHTGVRTAEGDQSLLYYAIDAQNTAGLSDLEATNSLVVGKPYELPYVDVFDKTNQQFVWIEGDYADWNIGLAKISSDGDVNGYAMAFEPNRAEAGIYNLGKITLAGAKEPHLSFSYYAQPASDLCTLGVAIDTDQTGHATVVKQVDFQQETTTGWRPVDIDLTPFKDSDYIIVKFAMVSQSQIIVFDDLRIADADDTAVQTVKTDAPAAPYSYNVAGQRVSPTAKGLHIQHGRKYVVK